LADTRTLRSFCPSLAWDRFSAPGCSQRPATTRVGKARRNYAATSSVTRASGKKKVVAARFGHNDRLVDALNAQAFSALTASPCEARLLNLAWSEFPAGIIAG
jgi:hypothetical protein